MSQKSLLYEAFASRAPLVIIETAEAAEMYPYLIREYRQFLADRQMDPAAANMEVWDVVSGGARPKVVDRNGLPMQRGKSLLSSLIDTGQNKVGIDAFLRKIAVNLAEQDEGAPTLWVLENPKALFAGNSTAVVVPAALARLATYIQSYYSGFSRIVLLGVIGEIPSLLRESARVVPPSRPTLEEIERMLQKGFKKYFGDFPEPMLRDIGADEMKANIPVYARVLQGLGWQPTIYAVRRALQNLAAGPAGVLEVLTEEKINAVKKIAPFASVEMPPETPPPLVGLDAAKRELDLVKVALRSNDPRVRGGTGILLIGPPGTGKTEFTRFASYHLGVPLFRLNMEEMFTSLLGESQNRLRAFIEMVNAAGSCIVQLDEIEKRMPNLRGSASDGGTGAQMMSQILTWMQDAANEHLPIVFIATANTTGHLPPEMLARFPTAFVTDYPDNETLGKIFAAHMAKYGADIGPREAFALALFLEQVMAGQGMQGRRPVGRDVAQVVDRAVRLAFVKREDPVPTLEDVRQAIREIRENMVPVGDPSSGFYAIPVSSGSQSGKTTDDPAPSLF